MSPYFVNTGNYNNGEQLDRLGEFYAAAIHKHFGDKVTNVFGPSYKGIPIGTSTVIALNRKFSMKISLSFNRKEVKDHGEGGWLMGYNYGDVNFPQKVVIVEDVTTAGTSIRENLPEINHFSGVDCIGLVVSVDRMEKGPSGRPALKELEEEFGIKTVSLINFKDLLEYLKASEMPRREQLVGSMQEYWERYGAEA